MPACALAGRGHIKGSGVRSKPRLNCQLSMHGGDNAMTTRGCMLVRYCQARRPTQKTADFADNVLVGHLVSNQPVTGGQTSARSPPLCGAFLGQGHAVVTAGRAAPGAGAASGAGGTWDAGCSAPHGRPHTWSLPGGPKAPGMAPSPALSTLSPCLWDSLHLILL